MKRSTSLADGAIVTASPAITIACTGPIAVCPPRHIAGLLHLLGSLHPLLQDERLVVLISLVNKLADMELTHLNAARGALGLGLHRFWAFC